MLLFKNEVDRKEKELMAIDSLLALFMYVKKCFKIKQKRSFVFLSDL
ncbi:hypothetical protein [Brevibacillus laterosporus]|nr:hypothetical protein [Brevibacillus laterosporus]